jgi:GT2 family glycosyltransferase
MQSRDIRFMSGTERPSCDGYDADVVILALDRVDETIAAIHSALGQTGVSRHVTIVDQGSQPEALTRLAATVYGRTDATLVALEHNHGVPGGRNIGAALGRGRIIVGLDNDAIFDASDMLARIVAAFDADPNLGALGCRIVVDSTGDDDLSSWGYPAALLPRSRNSFEAVTFVGAGHAIRRETWDDAGGYDACLFFCWEEYDFCLRAIARFWRVRYRGDLVVRHKVSPERRVTWSGDRWFHYVRNRIYIGRKNGQSWLALTPRMIAYCVKAARNGCLSDTPRALWAAFTMAWRVKRNRLPPVAQDYLYRTDTLWRGSLVTRLRFEVLAALPGHAQRQPVQATEVSIRAMTSAGGAPASAAATHSASS